MDAGFCSKLQEQCFAIIGMGLIGGSYAKALRRLGVKTLPAWMLIKMLCSRHWQTE